jgi:hypothetical protein
MPAINRASDLKQRRNFVLFIKSSM